MVDMYSTRMIMEFNFSMWRYCFLVHGYVHLRIYLWIEFFSHIPMPTSKSGPYVSSLSLKSVPHRYQCVTSVTNKR